MYNSLDGYESPIFVAVRNHIDELVKKQENEWFTKIEEEVGFHIDKNELVKALNYERDQYSKGYSCGYKAGYKQGKADAIEELRKVINGEEEKSDADVAQKEIPVIKKTCETCKYNGRDEHSPCISCNIYNDKWEAKEVPVIKKMCATCRYSSNMDGSPKSFDAPPCYECNGNDKWEAKNNG